MDSGPFYFSRHGILPSAGPDMTTPEPPSFGHHLRRLRTAAALSQEVLAERAGLSARAVSDLERGVHQWPRLETVRLLADAFQLEENDRATLLAAARPELTVAPQSIAERASPRTALPLPLTRLIGREQEVAALSQLLSQGEDRLVTLTGPGGVGKTRLAQAVAADMRGNYPDGVFFVDLSPLTDPDLVLPTITIALGVREIAAESARDALSRYLRDRRLLILLDNCEQVLEAASDIAAVLASCPYLALLATSREPLHVRAEHEFEVTPLPFPDLSRLPLLDTLGDVAAVALFVERAHGVNADFALTAENAPAVVAICQRLDGLPLAIELAAARVKVLDPDQLQRRLERPLDLLATTMRDVPVRQRTMRAAIAWSYDLLPPPDQRHFRRLAGFVGGFTLAAAEAIVDDPTFDTLRGLTVLRAASLIHRIETANSEPDSAPRFGMLETIREFGQEELLARGDDQTARRLHLHFFVAFAVEAERHFIRGVDPAWLNALEDEHDNIRAALSWALHMERAVADRTLGLRLAGTLWLFWYYHSHLEEGRRWLERAIGIADMDEAPTPRRDRLRALVGLGALAHFHGDDAVAIPALEQSVRLGRQIDDPVDLAYALTLLGNVAEDSGRYREAEQFFREANDLFQGIDDSVNVAVTTYHLGIVQYGQGDVFSAIRLCERALELGRNANDPWTTAMSQAYLGLLHTATGDYELAALDLSEALLLYQQMGTTERVAEVVRRFAVLAATCELPYQALRLFAAADAMSGQIGAALALPERTDYDRARSQASLLVGATEARQAAEQGQRLPANEIIDEIQTVLDSVKSQLDEQ
jgi:predicted ATPase/DNA-binding XRE family transcriptional regulator